MKQFLYTFRYLVKGKGNNPIKIISLTLGLVVALVLFSKVAFEMSYDKHYPDAERIYRIQRTIYQDNKINYESESVYAAVPADLKSEIKEIEEATLTFNSVREDYFQNGDEWIKNQFLFADAHIFDVFGIVLLEGDKHLLGIESNLFLSKSAANILFGNENAIGKMLLRKSKPYIIAGIFEDLPAGHLEFDILLPIKEMTGDSMQKWANPEAFFAYVKLIPSASSSEVETAIKAVLPKFMDVEAMAANGNVHEYFLNPVTGIHANNATVKRLMLILSLLAFSLLFVAAMNYVLISISSLAKRAKSVGILKCNGASEKSVFGLFINETVIIICISLVFSALLIYIFGGFIETIIQTPLSAIFSRHNLWVAGAIIAGLILLAGVIPAAIFSAVPVTFLFLAYSTDRKYWKKILLFVQFAGAAFIVTLLIIIVKQYDLLMTNDVGYATENIVYSENIQDLSREEIYRLKTELVQIPQVEKASVASNLPIDFMSGIKAIDGDNKDNSFSARTMGVDDDFLETMQIKLIAGNNVGESSNNYSRALVNEKFVEFMGWQDSPVGKIFETGLSGPGSYTEVIGVVKNFQLFTLYENEFMEPVPPLILYPLEIGKENWLFGWNRIILKLHYSDSDLITELNLKMQNLVNRPNAYFVDYHSKIKASYKNTLLYRDSIIVASIILLVISILGLLGFTDDEINRRSKEIAIRKITGAEVHEVLVTISKSVVAISLPATFIGIVISYFIGNEWLRQFAIKTPLSVSLFIFSGLLIIFGIIICIVVRSWSVANENPAKNLKAE